MSTQEHAHVPGYGVYVKVWALLLGLTVVTVAASFADLKHVTMLVAVLIASVKVTLVALYFMHLRYDKAIYAWMLFVAGVTYAVFIALTFIDYWSRF